MSPSREISKHRCHRYTPTKCDCMKHLFSIKNFTYLDLYVWWGPPKYWCRGQPKHWCRGLFASCYQVLPSLEDLTIGSHVIKLLTNAEGHQTIGSCNQVAYTGRGPPNYWFMLPSCLHRQRTIKLLVHVTKLLTQAEDQPTIGSCYQVDYTSRGPPNY